VENVLLIINTRSHLVELMRVARMLKNTGKYKPDLLFTYFPPRKDQIECKSNAIAALDPSGRPLTPPDQKNNLPDYQKKRDKSSGSIKRRLWYLLERAPQKIKFLLYKAYFFFLHRFYSLPFWLWYYAHCYQSARKIVGGYDLLILAEDNVGYETAMWIKAANESNIPTIITPFTIANATEPAESLYHNPAYNLKRFTNHIAGRLYSKWIYDYKGQKLLRLPAAQVFAREWLRFSPPLPWIMNSGNIDAIAVESERMFQYYKDEGIPTDRLVITGSLSDDVLSENLAHRQERRASLCAELGIDPGRPLILCALPPDQFTVISKAQTDFHNYDELVQFWVKSLSEIPSSNVVVKLHPRSNYDDLKHICKWGAKISQRDTSELIPLCDIFVVCVSATIRWAIACSIPVVNYDVYRLGYADFKNVPGVLETKNKIEFRSLVARLVSDSSFYNKVAGQQKAVMSRWGKLDGKSTERVLSLCDQLIRSKRGLS